MLPAAMRMRAKDDFTTTVRRGRRCGQQRLVVHLLLPAAVRDPLPDLQEQEVPAMPSGFPQVRALPVDRGVRVGFVVSRQVGPSVVRNRVERRLRHVCRPLAPSLPDGARLVVRANPAAAGATSAELDADLRAALRRCLDRRRTDRAVPR